MIGKCALPYRKEAADLSAPFAECTLISADDGIANIIEMPIRSP
jgi:hypothetical protein